MTPAEKTKFTKTLNQLIQAELNASWEGGRNRDEWKVIEQDLTEARNAMLKLRNQLEFKKENAK